jgi:hypothetical protein
LLQFRTKVRLAASLGADVAESATFSREISVSSMAAVLWLR